jgi:hypothetical protein
MNTVVVERAGAAVLVRATDAPGASAPCAAVLREESRHQQVVVDGTGAEWLHSPYVLDALRKRLGADKGVRLVAGMAGAPAPNGAPAPATHLANQLGVDVLAPDGPLLVLPGGELFAVGDGAGWVSYGRGRRPVKRGPRAPEPSWQRHLPLAWDAGEISANLDVVPIPAGLWLRRKGSVSPLPTSPAFGICPEGDRMAVVLGEPGAALHDVGILVRALNSLSPELWSALYLAEFGTPAREVALAQRIADAVQRPVRARTAMSFYGQDHLVHTVCLNHRGVPTWQPFGTEFVHHPGGGPPAPWLWRSPAAFASIGSGVFQLGEGWVVEVVASGLLVRAAGMVPPPGIARRPVDPDRCDIVLAPPERPGFLVPATVLASIEQLVRTLPAETSSRVSFVALPGVPAVALAHLRAALGTSVVGLDYAQSVARSAPQPLPAVPSGPAVPAVPRAGSVHSGVPAMPPRPAVVAGPFHVDADGRAHPQGQGWQRGPARAGAVSGPAASSGPPDLAGMSTVSTTRPVAADTPVAPATASAGAPMVVSAAPSPAPAVVPDHSTEPVARPEVHATAAQPEHAEVSDVDSDAPVVDPAAHGAVLGPFTEGDPLPLLSGHRSGPADRLAFRTSLGWRYDAATRAVARLLAERPGLRTGATSTEEMITELAAVQLFSSADHSALVAAIRSGDLAEHLPFASCLAGGLDRLQSVQAVVLRGGPGDAAAADVYEVGADLVEPAPLLATADLATAVAGEVEVLIWSLSARRLSGLVDADRDGDVVFPPATRFRVLAVDATERGRRVLMTELPRAEPARDEPRLARWLTRLRSAAEQRDRLAAPSAPGTDACCVALPGLLWRPAA